MRKKSNKTFLLVFVALMQLFTNQLTAQTQDGSSAANAIPLTPDDPANTASHSIQASTSKWFSFTATQSKYYFSAKEATGGNLSLQYELYKEVSGMPTPDNANLTLISSNPDDQLKAENLVNGQVYYMKLANSSVSLQSVTLQMLVLNSPITDCTGTYYDQYFLNQNIGVPTSNSQYTFTPNPNFATQIVNPTSGNYTINKLSLINPHPYFVGNTSTEFNCVSNMNICNLNVTTGTISAPINCQIILNNSDFMQTLTNNAVFDLGLYVDDQLASTFHVSFALNAGEIYIDKTIYSLSNNVNIKWKVIAYF